MHFRQISIIGVGLLGGSLGLTVRQRKLAQTVVGIGHREATLREAIARGAVDRHTLDVAEGVRGADLVVLATPVGLFGRVMEQAGPALARGCLITDVGSTKRAVLEAVLPHVPPDCSFVGSHPLAGGEERSIKAARADLYDDALVFVVPTARSDEAGVETIERFWQAVGARIRRIDAASHDRLLAQSSHLPHLVAAALVNALTADAEQAVGKGFLDTTRIASGDGVMWRDILLTNRDEVLRALAQLEAGLASARSSLEKAQAEAIREFLEQAKTRRDRLRGS